jgi:hypothetical protein
MLFYRFGSKYFASTNESTTAALVSWGEMPLRKAIFMR